MGLGIVTNPRALDIDRIVPLSYAWSHGADKWDSIDLSPPLKAGALRAELVRGLRRWLMCMV